MFNSEVKHYDNQLSTRSSIKSFVFQIKPIYLATKINLSTFFTMVGSGCCPFGSVFFLYVDQCFKLLFLSVGFSCLDIVCDVAICVCHAMVWFM